jgi:hypothetical protein
MSGVIRLALGLMLAASPAAVHAGQTVALRVPTLLPVRPAEPQNGATIDAADTPINVTLAWTVPAEPTGVQFFVEVMALQPNGPHEVFASYADHSPVVVTLSGTEMDYAWRVYTVGRDVAGYALGAWRRFSVQNSK